MRNSMLILGIVAVWSMSSSVRAGDAMLGARFDTAYTLEPQYDQRWTQVKYGRAAIELGRDEWRGQRELGAKITQLVPGAPADLADLRVGDVITEFHGTTIADAATFVAAVNSRSAGETAKITFVRNGQRRKIEVTLAVRANEFPARKVPRSAEDARDELKDIRARFYPEDEAQADRIEAIDFDHYAGVTDRSLQDIAKLPAVRMMRFPLDRGKVTPITSIGLKAISDMKSIESLVLEGDGWGDDALKIVLGGLKLKHLLLKKTSVSRAALEAIARQTGLEYLVLSECRIDDTGLGHLVSLENLRHLELDRANLLKSADFLKSLKNLEVLALPGCTFGDKQMPALAGLTELAYVNLSSTELTDAGLPHLSGAKKLLVFDAQRSGETILKSELAKRQRNAFAGVAGGLAEATTKERREQKSSGNPVIDELEAGSIEEFQGSPGVSKNDTVRVSVTGPGLKAHLGELRDIRVIQLGGIRLPGGDIRDLGRHWPQATIVTQDKTIQPARNK